MTSFQFSAHDLCITRLCQAGGCEQDAEHGWVLCARHDRQHRRGVKVVLHEIPPPLPDTLRCHGACRQDKPDEAYGHDKKSRTRRYRSGECRDCKNARTRTPEARAKQNAYRAKRRAAKSKQEQIVDSEKMAP